MQNENRNLHREFVKLSFDIIKMKNKLISLLLEIYEQEIYKKHGCRTIYEYAFKYAKLSKEVVDKAVRTLKHLENKPFLKSAIETQGIHKVALVATIATPETDRIFAGHVENMSKPALFEFSKELRIKGGNCERVGDADGNRQMQISIKDEKIGVVKTQFCQAVRSKMQIELDAEMQTLFLKFKGKYAKNLSNKEALRMMLKKVDGMEMENTEVGEDGVKFDGTNNCQSTDHNYVPGNVIAKEIVDQALYTGKEIHSDPKFPSRYINKQKNCEVRAKYHNKCAYPGCVKTIETMHHRIPFAFERSHESIIPLCDVHHEFAHNGLIAYELKEPEKWQLKTAGNTSIFDQFYLKKRAQT